MPRATRTFVPGLAVFVVALLFFFNTGTPGAPVEHAAPDPPDFRSSVRPSPLVSFAQVEGSRLTATLESYAQIVLLPAEARSVRLEAIIAFAEGEAHEMPLDLGGLGSVMIQRGRPLLPVSVDRDALEGQLGVPVDRVQFRMEARDATGAPISGSRAGAEVAGEIAAGGETPALLRLGAASFPGANRGGYLIIADAQYTDELQPLVEWKTACGYDVTFATTIETGTSRTEIRDYVRNAYETWETPPAYLLLVGDARIEGDLPSFNALGNVNDHLYACVDGDDFLADLFVGRFSARTSEEVAVQVAKTVGYESSPDTSAGAAWFSHALLVAGNSGSSTPIPTSRWVRDQLFDVGFTQADTVWYPPFWSGVVPITYYINQGVSLVNYRGWAQGDTAWQPPEFGSTSVRRLENGWKLPVVFSIVCHTGNFGSIDVANCFGEEWLKAGTPAAPRGGVAFIGTGEHYSHSRWNDRMDIGLFEMFRYHGLRQMGPLLVGAKTTLLAHFPTEVYLEETGEESVEYYQYIYNLLGDPSLTIWTGIPRSVRVDNLPRSITFGTNHIALHVTEADGVTAIAGAHLALVQGGELIGYGVTDDAGGATVSLGVASADEIQLTVTGENLYPLQAAIQVIEEAHFLTATGVIVSGGGALLPGVDLDLLIELTNSGSSRLEGGTITVTGPDGVEILTPTAEFGVISAGESAQTTSPIGVRIAAATEDGARLRLLATPDATGIGTLAETEVWMRVEAPAYTCTAQSDDGDDIFDPGEQIELVLTLRNDGHAVAGASDARLELLAPEMLTVTDSVGTFAEIAPGESGNNVDDPFGVRIEETTAIGAAIPMKLTVVGAGPEVSVYFNLVVGEADFAAPIGPDGGGYYCYDSADIDYPGQVPAYRWVECSPAYGGLGTAVGITADNRAPKIVPLPFSFTYYGEVYDSVRVSDNGWITFDTEYWYDIRNWSMPNPWGAASQLAAFWDNLDPTIDEGDDIYTWYDSQNHRFIVEWSRLMNFESQNQTIPNPPDDFQTFEIILYDPARHPTTSGDGEIVFQYRQIINDDWYRMYSTVGIEDPTEEVGILYTYDNLYADGAAPLSPGLAIKFTTEAPVRSPLAAELFEAVWAAAPAGDAPDKRPGAGEVRVRWRLTDERPIRGLRLWRAEPEGDDGWSEAQPVHEGLLASDDVRFTDSGADPDGRHLYRLKAVGPRGKERLVGETIYPGFAAERAELRVVGGNPAVGETAILFRGGAAVASELAIYDANGRRVRTLYREIAGGPHGGVLAWDGRDQGGHPLPSGLYWARLLADQRQKTARVLILR